MFRQIWSHGFISCSISGTTRSIKNCPIFFWRRRFILLKITIVESQCLYLEGLKLQWFQDQNSLDHLLTFNFFFNFYFDKILYLQKSYKNNAKNFWTPFIQISQILTFYHIKKKSFSSFLIWEQLLTWYLSPLMV